MRTQVETKTAKTLIQFIEHQAKQNQTVFKALEDITKLIGVVNDKVNNLKN